MVAMHFRAIAIVCLLALVTCAAPARADETTDQVITSDNTVNVPAHAYKYSQPA